MGLRAALREWFAEMNEDWNSDSSFRREEAVFMFVLTAILSLVGLLIAAAVVIVALAVPVIAGTGAALLAALFLAFRRVTKPGRFDQ